MPWGGGGCFKFTSADASIVFRLPLVFGYVFLSCCISLQIGMDKILQSVGGGGGGNSVSVTVTNDGATILRSIHVDNAAAKVCHLSVSANLLYFPRWSLTLSLWAARYW